ncbi:MAG: diguanylate cyclase, partial [Myxococcales bacterium]
MRGFVTRPLFRLTEAMRRAEKGDFLTRARVERDDEIGRLASAFNSMLTRITEMKVAEIEANREMESMQRELALKAELERRIRDLTLLFDVTRSLNSTLELDEILKLVTEMVANRLGFQQFSMMLLDGKTGELVVKTSSGFADPEAVGRFRLPVGQGASGIAAETREPMYVRDVQNDARYVRGPYDPDGEASLLAVPMVCKEKVVGVLNFARAGKDAFSENDILLMQLVGNQAAMAIVNARLFQETVELTLTDALTAVFNRRHLFARLEMEITRALRFSAPVALIMIDIDHFKHLNDTAGHPAGDKVLKGVADLLKKTVRKVDTVARYGGEEFAVILPMVPSNECFEVAEKLRKVVERTPFDHGDSQPGGRITISIGVAVFPEHGHTLEQLLDAADSALYASKRGGRNRVTLYSPGMELHPGRE